MLIKTIKQVRNKMIIGIGGEKQHGKDTVANYLVEKYGYQRKAFADKLKSICQELYPSINIYDEANKETLFSSPLLLSLGTLNKLKYELECFGYTINQSLGNKMNDVCSNKKDFKSIRDMLQFIGTNIIRDLIDADFHYNSVAKWIDKEFIKYAVISDCRFANERQNIRSDYVNSRLIKVVRPSMQKNSSSNHASENSLGNDNEYDYVIINDGSLQDLYTKVDKIMEELNITKEVV